jgi:hypothetical protein
MTCEQKSPTNLPGHLLYQATLTSTQRPAASETEESKDIAREKKSTKERRKSDLELKHWTKRRLIQFWRTTYLTLGQPCRPRHPLNLLAICSKKKILSDQSVMRYKLMKPSFYVENIFRGCIIGNYSRGYYAISPLSQT